MNSAKECEYGQRCYRKNPSHFADFKHKHLNELFESLEDKNEIVIPENYKAMINKATLVEQLEILKKLKFSPLNSNNGSERSSSPKIPRVGSGNQPSTSRSKVERQQQMEENATHKRFSNAEPQEKRQKLLKEENSSSKMENNPSLNRQIKEDYQQNSSASSKPLSSEEHRKKMQSARNMSEAMEYFKEVKKRSKGSIVEKHEASAPYYFFLTSVTDSHKTHAEPLSLQLFDILDPSLGDLESSLQINFMVEIGWLLAQYHVSNQRGKPITLLYGEMDSEDVSSMKHLTALKIKCPSPFGSHHTKMCVMAYRDGSVRVCVHTANLVESDWDNRVQGVWLSPACPALPLDADSDAGEAPTHFKRDLIQYLSAYRLPELQPWIAKLRRVDFSHINVYFVASTPGAHKGVDGDKWGWPKLGKLLKENVQIPPKSGSGPSSWQIIAQCSSIGSLGPQPTSWFCGEIKQAMSAGLGLGLHSPPPIKLVYPSFSNVAGSYDGLLGGGCLPYSKKTHSKQPWLQQYLYEWKCEERHRTRAMPHIKTYCRVSPDLSQLAWFHLTSANLSKAAWGTQSKAGATNILSYEAGVLFLPKFVTKTNCFPIQKNASNDVPLFPMPYDLPLSKFSSDDVPWFIDVLSS